VSGSRTRTSRGAIVFLALLLGGCPERTGPTPPSSSLGQQATATPAPSAPAGDPIGAGSAAPAAGDPVPPGAAPSVAAPGSAPDSISAPEGTASSSPDEPTTPRPSGLSATSPWSSREACQRFLATAEATAPANTRAAEPSAGAKSRGARVGTWNIRWYPDGRPGKKAGVPGTDILWLACAIAVLEVDVLAVQEIKTLPRARERTAELLAELDRLTGGRWRAEFDDCPQQATQHVGLLWNETRATLTRLHTEPALNPHGTPCKDSLRPGFVADARFVGGATARIVSVHFKSGAERRSVDLRKKSFTALEDVVKRARRDAPATQLIFAGDFNTMGCSSCSPKIAAEEERASVEAQLASFGLRWLPTEPGCTEYYRDRGHLLDGFVVTEAMAQQAHLPARAEGLCRELACERTPQVGLAPAMRQLSDHCPVVIEFGNE